MGGVQKRYALVGWLAWRVVRRRLRARLAGVRDTVTPGASKRRLRRIGWLLLGVVTAVAGVLGWRRMQAESAYDWSAWAPTGPDVSPADEAPPDSDGPPAAA